MHVIRVLPHHLISKTNDGWQIKMTLTHTHTYHMYRVHNKYHSNKFWFSACVLWLETTNKIIQETETLEDGLHKKNKSLWYTHYVCCFWFSITFEPKKNRFSLLSGSTGFNKGKLNMCQEVFLFVPCVCALCVWCYKCSVTVTRQPQIKMKRKINEKWTALCQCFNWSRKISKFLGGTIKNLYLSIRSLRTFCSLEI